jgi:hypothetical protein
MRFTSSLAVVLALIGLAVGAEAFGQTSGGRLWAPYRSAADDGVPDAPAPDVVEPEAPDALGTESDPFADEPAPLEPTLDSCGGKSCGDCGGKGCGKGGGHFGLGSRLACMCDGEPFKIWPGDGSRGIDAGGWVQIGYTTEGTNGDGTGLFNSYPNVVQLQQAWLYVEKAIDEDRCKSTDWGFRMDYVYGTDGPNTQAFGGEPGQYDFGWDNGFEYGHAIPQAYLQAAYNDLKVTFGHFFTICGYEVVPAPNNFFYSHAFTMVRAEPFTHTGVLAEYAMGENITVWGGWSAGWDTGFTQNGGDVFIGGFSVDLLDSVTFTYTSTVGDFGFDFEFGGVSFPGSDQDAYSHSIVLDVAVTEKFTYVVQSDYIDNDILILGQDPFGWATTWGVNQYLLYQFNDCVGAGLRYEYFDQEVYEVTATTVGLHLKPHPNLIVRPEVRYEDWDNGNLLGRTDATIFGVDMIMTF